MSYTFKQFHLYDLILASKVERGIKNISHTDQEIHKKPNLTVRQRQDENSGVLPLRAVLSSFEMLFKHQHEEGSVFFMGRREEQEGSWKEQATA